MIEKSGSTSIGGVTISGTIGAVGGDIVGGDKIVTHQTQSLDFLLGPIANAIAEAPREIRAEAELQLEAIKTEAGKGPQANDGILAKVLDQLVGLIPGAASAVSKAFADPILAQIAGPVTNFVLDKLR